MKYFFAILAVGASFSPADAADAFEIPFRRTDTQHILVRAKINGQGPFNFIVDTGAPLVFLATPAGKKLGLKTENDWATVDTFELEGGAKLDKVFIRVETPFQLEGMNGMGLAGAELHGILGYTLLSRFKIEIDLTKSKMIWTPNQYEPATPNRAAGKGGQPGGLDMIGSVMKVLGFLSGAKTTPERVPRVYLGIDPEPEGKDVKGVLVSRVYADSPAGKAGLKVGDRILEINGKLVKALPDLERLAGTISAGQTVRMLIRREKSEQELKLIAEEGL